MGGSQMFELNREFYKNSTFLSMLISTTSSSTDFILQGWNTVTYQNSCVDFVQNMLAWVSTVWANVGLSAAHKQTGQIPITLSPWHFVLLVWMRANG